MNRARAADAAQEMNSFLKRAGGSKPGVHMACTCRGSGVNSAP